MLNWRSPASKKNENEKIGEYRMRTGPTSRTWCRDELVVCVCVCVCVCLVRAITSRCAYVCICGLAADTRPRLMTSYLQRPACPRCIQKKIKLPLVPQAGRNQKVHIDGLERGRVYAVTVRSNQGFASSAEDGSFRRALQVGDHAHRSQPRQFKLCSRTLVGGDTIPSCPISIPARAEAARV